jgi:hypothetical protein
MRAALATFLAAASALVAAAPLAGAPVVEPAHHNVTLGKRANTQTITQCTVSGQIALTFDGPCFLRCVSASRLTCCRWPVQL